MRTKVTLILLLLNAALAFFIFYVEHDWQVKPDHSRRVLGAEAVNLQKIEIKAGDAAPVTLVQRAGAWSLTSPVDWPANEFAVQRILSELQFLEHETSFLVKDLARNGQSLADYGLDPAKPRFEVSFTNNPSSGAAPVTTRLVLGDATKIGGRLYVLSPDGDRIHVVSQRLADSLDLGVDQLRAETLFTIPVFEVRSLGLQSADGPRVRLRRDGSRWSFEAPIVARAAKTSTEVALSSLNALRAGRFLAERDAPPERTGLAAPSLRITLEGNNRRDTLQLGLPVPPPAGAAAAKVAGTEDTTEFHALLDDRRQVFTVALPNALVKTLRHAQEDLRETRLLDFEPSAVTAVTLSTPARPTQPELTLRRSEAAAGTWQALQRTAAEPQTLTADTALVQRLLDRLSLLAARSPVRQVNGEPVATSPFVNDAPSAADLETLGFSSPEREITLTFAPPATPTASGLALAEPTRITLQIALGTAESGGHTYARVSGKPFIYAVPADTLTLFPVAARVYRDRVIRTLPEGAQITGLNLALAAGDGPPVYTRKLADGETWSTVLAAEPAERRAALEALLVHLRTLRARQFVADTYAPTVAVGDARQPWKYRLDVTLALGGGADGQSGVSTLYLSERLGGGTQLAGSAEFNTVFELEQPLLDALWTLLYAARDPGPPAVIKPAEPAPAAAP